MSMHDEYVRRVEEQAEAWKNDDIDITNKEVCDRERLTLCGALIKCADIGNCVSQWDSVLYQLLIAFWLRCRLGHLKLPKVGLKCSLRNSHNKVT